MTIENEVSPIEVLMESALKENKISFDKQIPCYGEYTYKNHHGYYRKKADHPKYILDFVVFGEKSRIVVECDGLRYHSSNKRKARDAVRDLWLITNGYDDVLRFSSHDIFNNLPSCILKIKKTIIKMDHIYHQQDEKKHFQPSAFLVTPSKPIIMKTINEFLTILTSSNENRKRKKWKADGRANIQNIQQRLRKQHFNLSYDLMHFHYPDLVRYLNERKIDIFFSGYNIPYLAVFNDFPLDFPLDVSKGSPFIKVIISNTQPIETSLKNWIWIHRTNKKIMASDILEIDYRDTLLQELSEKAALLEKEYIQLCKQKSKLVQTKHQLRNIYQKMYTILKTKNEESTELFAHLDASHKKMLVKEMKNHWSWIAYKSKYLENIDSFKAACDWFEECGIPYIERYSFTLYDVVLQMHQFYINEMNKRISLVTRKQKTLSSSKHDQRKKVQIYIYSNGRNDLTIFEFEGKFQEVYEQAEDSRSVNRSILHACIRSLQTLKEPCFVTLYIQTNIGLKYMQKPQKKWVNRDLGNLIQKTVQEGNHLIEFIDYSIEKRFASHRKALKQRLTKKFG